MSSQRLILASTSPRRKELLRRLGLAFDVVEPRFDESPTSRPAREECLHFASEKALSVKDLCPDSLIIGCDTLIECEGEILGKPEDVADAARILAKLSDRTHRVHTGVVLLNTVTGETRGHVETAEVTFRKMTDQEVRDYVATGEPMGKAGAYAVQGKARKLFIESVKGEEEAVIGLPLKILREWLLNP